MGEFWRKLMRLRRRDEWAERMREELEFHRTLHGSEIGNRGRILEQAHDIWTFGAIEQVFADLRFAARALARSPAFFLLAACGTALGVSALTAVISVADTALVRSLPYRQPSRLVVISDQLLRLDFPRFPISTANFLDYRAQNHAFEDIAAFEPRAMTVQAGDRAERVAGMLASADLLPLLGTTPFSGRWFEPAENHRGHPTVAVLSYAFAQSHPGPEVRIDDQICRVIGVLPPAFAFRLSGEAPQVWLPEILDPGPRDSGNLQAVARLRKGVGLGAAQAEMHVIAAGLKQRYHTGMGPHGEDGGYDVVVVPLREELYGAVRSTLLALAGAGAILLALGLANTALLWMGRAAARRKEAIVRLALGATGARVARQLIAEALLPSLAGGVLALALTLGALAVLNASPPSELATIDAFTPDYRVFAGALLVSALAGVLFGALPARPAFRQGTGSNALIQDRGGVTTRGETRMRQVLIAVQMALVCSLLAPALLLLQSLAALERIDPGVHTEGLVAGYVSVPPGHAPDAVEWYRKLEAALHARLGARVTLASLLPLGADSGGDPFSIEGRAFGASGTLPQMGHTLRVGEGYFDVMGIRILSGRGFEPRDFAEATHAVVVNDTLAKAFWPGQSPLGAHVLPGAPRPGAEWLTIVGTAADIHTAQLSEAPLPQIYFPYPQRPARTMAIVADVRQARGLAAAVRAVDPAVPLFSLQSMSERVARSVERPRLRAQLFGSYGALACALAAFGIYSVSFYSALRRRREFAVRAALGATRGRLWGLVMAGTLGPSALGSAAGLAIGFAIARALAAFLFRTSPGSPGVYLLSGMAALGVAALAAAIGCRGAVSANPAGILRAD